MEQFGRQAGRMMGRAIDDRLATQQADEHFQRASCPTCGAPGESDAAENKKTRPLQTVDGTIPLAEPVTSALMESFVKELNQRVKGTEKFWDDGLSGEAILQLRAAALCDDRLSIFLHNRPGNPFCPNATPVRPHPPMPPKKVRSCTRCRNAAENRPARQHELGIPLIQRNR